MATEHVPQPDAAQSVAGPLESSDRRDQGSPPLTRRELEVLVRLALGESAPQIAAHLSVAYPTVKTHLANLYRKLGVSERAAAVTQAFLAGLLSAEIVHSAGGPQ